MRFEHIVLLIIAFNVVSAVLQRRAKKAREKADGNASAQASAPDAAEPREPLRGRLEDAGEADRSADRAERKRARARARAGRRDREQRPAGAPAASERVDRMPSFGRDILDQLARDLGLKLPESGGGSPEDAAPSRRPRRTPEEIAPRRLPDERPVRGEPRPLVREERMERLPVSPPVPAREEVRRPVAAEPPRVAAGAETLREDLRGSRALRRAFVLKEVLDVPVARRRRPFRP